MVLNPPYHLKAQQELLVWMKHWSICEPQHTITFCHSHHIWLQVCWFYLAWRKLLQSLLPPLLTCKELILQFIRYWVTVQVNVVRARLYKTTTTSYWWSHSQIFCFKWHDRTTQEFLIKTTILHEYWEEKNSIANYWYMLPQPIELHMGRCLRH